MSAKRLGSFAFSAWLAGAAGAPPQAGYIDSARCRSCHAAIYDSYRQTGMGRSVRAEAAREGVFYHRLSNRHYAVQAGRMARHQVDASGAPVNHIERKIDFGIGSGNHATTYVHRDGQGKLIELPVSWYSAGGGYYAMSPGYDRPDHLDFRREIPETCLFCHAAYPRSGAPGIEPIDCQRCHGPGAAHAARPVRENVVNPARLDTARRLDVCLQCHLETASRGIPDSLHVPGRGVYSFRPGERLSDFKVYFDRAGPPPVQRFEINHAGYSLIQSACFTKSDGRLGCTSCHDSHSRQVKNACAACHASVHAKTSGDCVQCHMPKRKTQDAVHVRMTDHWIGRPPLYREPQAEDHQPYTGALVGFRNDAARLIEKARLLHRASANPNDIEALRALQRAEPDSPRRAIALGEALFRAGSRQEAISLLDRASRDEPTDAVLLNTLAVYHATEGRLGPALELLRKSAQANPDHPLTWLNLGVTHEARDELDMARDAYREAVRLQPDFVEARARLARLGVR